MLYQQLFGDLYYDIYGNIFAFELFVCLTYFVIFQPRRKYFELRACLSFAGYLILVNVTWFIIRSFGAHAPYITEVFFFLSAFYLAVGVFCSFKTNLLGAVYFATGAYAFQHMTYSLINIIRSVFAVSMPVWAAVVVFDILFYAVMGCAFFFILVYPRRYRFGSDIFDIRAFVLSLFILALCVVLSSSVDNIFAEYIKEGVEIGRLRICCSLYAFAGCLCAIVLQFGFLRENKLTGEKRILDQLIRNEKKHHEMTKETIGIINAKCHDLKHQISLLEDIDNREARKENVREVENAIAIYDSVAETGNDTLDIVISEKSLICEKNNISLSCLVDGEKIAFMSTADIAVLFGNAFDNAIEKEICEEEDRRFISVSVRESNGFVYVHMDNYCSVPPEFIGGLPQTTKGDKYYHGFGTKSIAGIVAKYSGELSMNVEEERFNLDILFPPFALDGRK